MNVLVYLVTALLCFIVAYRLYGKYIAKAIGEDKDLPTPAHQINDGKDFIPTRPSVLFAHHYSTIAGAGPIVGPTLGILYGVGPAWLWIVFGAIFFGAVHDFVSLFASIREKGQSVAEIAKKGLGQSGFLMIIIFTIILIILVTSAFLSLTAISLTSLYPLEKLGLESSQTMLRTSVVSGQTMGIVGGIASTSVIIITFLAPLLGYLVTKKQIKTYLAFIIAAAICIFSIYIGFYFPLSLNPTIWMLLISVYTLFACQAPVWLILQPRDFVNVQILYIGMALLTTGVVISGFQGVEITAPVANLEAGTAKMGPIWPFLFITIACGAISGFHSLVSGGTTSKQLDKEKQAKAIGYGGMLLEGLLAVLVIIVIGSSLKFSEYMNIAWPTVGKGNPVLAFALSMGHMLHNTIGISLAFGTVMGILIVEGFLITTLDSAVRLNRYLFEELWKALFTNPPKIMSKFWFNSGLSVVLMLLIAWTNGYKLIWPLFGSTNQLMAALTLIAVSVWLYNRKKPTWFTMIPAVIMVVTTIASLSYKLFTDYLPGGNIILISIDILLLLLSLGVIRLSVLKMSSILKQSKAEISS